MQKSNDYPEILVADKDDVNFWVLWQELYPVYKKIYPSMNPELYEDKLKEKIASYGSNKKFRILICGAGDEDTLKFIERVVSIRKTGRGCDLVLLDFCNVALKRSKAYADRNSLKIDFVFEDILNYAPKEKFDAIVSDGFIDFFTFESKKKLLQKWNEILNDRGVVLTTVPIEDPSSKKSFVLKEYFSIALKSFKKKQDPLKKVIGYHRLAKACNTLQKKQGKNESFKNDDAFFEMCTAAALKIDFFKYFYKYNNPSWHWYSCVLSKSSQIFSTDRFSLIEEVNSMIQQEKKQLKEHSGFLNNTLKLDSVSSLDNQILKNNIEFINSSISDLCELSNFVSNQNKPDCVVFNEIIKLGNYVFRKSVASRTSLLRHTPALKGLPVSIDPSQNHVLIQKQHTVDYGRGGYILFQQPDKEPKTLFKDHPHLEKVAKAIVCKLYGASPDLKSLIFTCGLGAINTFNDYMRSLSSISGRKNYVGENCWLELKKHILESNDQSFIFFDETNKDKIINLLEDQEVQSICLEGIQNYTTLRATDLEHIFSKIKKMSFSKPKFLIIDHVVTFDVNLFEKYFSKGMPKNFCLAVFISGIKFFQGGWDISKSGFLVLKYNENDFDKQSGPRQRLIEIRAGSGRVPSLEEAYLSNIDTTSSLKSRIERYDRNTKYLANFLNKKFKENGLGQVFSAWLQNHPDYEVAKKCYNTGGRIIYLKLNEKYFKEDKLLALYQYISNQAFKDKISIMAASNFGFCCPHIHMVRHNKFGLSLRISPGSTDFETTKLIGKYIVKKIEEFK